MKTSSFAALAALAACALPTVVAAQTQPVAGETAAVITVTDAYARSNNPKVGAAFMTITNSGSADCALTAATSDVAARTELHTHREEAGVMKMMQVDSIAIPAGATHELARGGDHVMFIEITKPLAQGDTVALTLDFGACGQVPLSVTVDNAAGADGMSGGMGHGMSHGHGMGGAPASN